MIGRVRRSSRAYGASGAEWVAHAWRSTSVTRIATFALFGALALFVLLTFDQHGISNDEQMQHVYGGMLLDWYTSGLRDRSAFYFRDVYMYGGMFDMLAAAIERLGVAPDDIWDVRHLLSGMFGVVGVAGVWKLGKLLGGDRAGFVAALLLTLTGAWSGVMFTHTKDVPFAACMTWAVYYLCRIAPQLPAPSPGLVIRFGIALGCAFGQRVGALFGLVYLFLMVGAAVLLIAPGGWRNKARFLARSAWGLLPAVPVVVALMALFWPWSMMAYDHLYRCVKWFSFIDFPINTLLNGDRMLIRKVPGTYLPWYLMVRLPEFVLLGLASALWVGVAALRRVSWNRAADRSRLVAWVPLLCAAAFPIAYALMSAPALFNGVRHFTFVVPVLSVIAALGLRGLWHRAVRWRAARVALLASFAGLLTVHTAMLAALHPYEYVYYNGLSGDAARMAERWELDYWSSSVREAAEMLEDFVKAEGRLPNAPYKVAVCAELVQADAWLGPEFVLTRNWLEADFYLSTTHDRCDRALAGTVVGVVSRRDLVLAVVKDRRSLVQIPAR